MQSQRTRTHLTGIPYLCIETYLSAVEMVGTIVDGQLIILAIQCELTFADAVSPSSNQSRKVRFFTAGKLFYTSVSLDDITYIPVFIGNHDSYDSTTIIRHSNLVTFTVLKDVQICFLSIDRGLEIFTIQTTQIRVFSRVIHIPNVLSY